MVAIYNEDDFGANPKTLCDWVKNFRIKKVQMRRKFRGGGGDLRVCAILSTALLSAEHELRRKQQERFNRWLEMQGKLDATNKNPLGSSGGGAGEQRNYCSSDDDNGYDGYVQQPNGAVDKMVASDDREEITNLWRYELSGLDEFMRNISSSSNNNNNNINNLHIHSNNSNCNSNNNCGSASSRHAIQVAS